MEEIKVFLDNSNIKFNDLKLYHLSFYHSSYIHETPWYDESYDRLEFFGDSILGFFITEYIYHTFPEHDEGDMTLLKHYLVNKEALSTVGRKLNLEKYMYLGKGQDRNNLADSIYEDMIESLIAAIYLDAGPEEAKKFIMTYIASAAEGISLDDLKDPKTKLQELLQADSRKSVSYRTDRGNKTDDGKLIFTAEAIFDDNVIGKGQGLSKKDAEKNAAKDAMDRMA